MNTIKNPTKILNIFIYLFALLTLTKGDIINNPVSISIPTNLINPIKVKESDYYYILSSGKYLILGFTGNKVAEGNFEEYSSPYTWINDESNNKYIFAKDKYINVIFNGNSITYKTLTKPTFDDMEYPDSNVHIGSMTETSSGDLESCLQPIEKDEVIIYGKNGSNYLVFTFLKLKHSFKFQYDNMEDKIDCKVVHKGCYLCNAIIDKTVHFLAYSHLKYGVNGKMSEDSTYLSTFQAHTYVQLSEFNNGLYFFCAKNRNTKIIGCQFFSICQFQGCNQIKYEDCERTNTLSLPTPIEINQDLIVNEFGGEKLFCYGATGFIKCYRVQGANDIVNEFTLEFPGTNSKLSFFTGVTNGQTYGNLIFYNENNGNNNLYEYFIYLPSCQYPVQSFSVIIYHSNEYVNRIWLNNFFQRKTNTKYYIEFETLPDEYGYLNVNGVKITGENSKILIEENPNYYLGFTSTNNKTVNNFKIPYKILINETYSAECSIGLTIRPCYDSCAKCSYDKSASKENDHNCLECKPGYYPSPLLETNCFKLEEKPINWYLDSTTNKFKVCNEKCKSCNGSNSDNCLTCFTPQENQELSHLSDGQCIKECPEGTYAVEQSEGYYKCEKCYKNCLNCTQGEIYSNSVLTDMNCLYCKKGEDPND